MSGGTLKTKIFILIIVLNYIPLLFLPIVNNMRGSIGGLPILWIYMILWVLFSFSMLVIAYVVDRRMR